MIAPQLITLDALTPEDVVVTPNQRSARAWREDFARQQITRGRSAWRMPHIFADTTWYIALWNELRLRAASSHETLPQVLTANQERVLWTRVVEENPASGALGSVADHVRSAMAAWTLAQRFFYQPNAADGTLTHEQRAFNNWCAAFNAHLAARRAVTLAQLPALLANVLNTADQPIILPSLPTARIVTLPVIQAEPAFERVLRALVARGVIHVEISLGDVAPQVTRTTYATEQDEWYAAASWAKSMVDAGARRVLVVVPELHRQRHAVTRTFQAVLCPELREQPLAQTVEFFDLSLGVRLSEMPFVASALALLSVRGQGIALAAVRSVFAADFLIRTDRAWLRNRIERGVEVLSVNEFRDCCRFTPAQEDALATFLACSARKALPSEHANAMQTFSVALGFPGSQLETVGRQALAAWTNALRALATLDELLEKVSMNRALNELRSICAAHDFQPEGQAAPVQIVGLYESLGLRCDGLWVTGLDDTTLPARAQHNPYLPIAWQRLAGAGRATPELMRASANAMWAQWQAAAPVQCVSHVQSDDEAPRRPSSLIVELPLSDALTPVPEHSMVQASSWIDDSEGSPLTGDTLIHGLRSIEGFAHCPFQGYAISRAMPDPWPDAPLGVSPLERGQAIHLALQQLWSNVLSSTRWNEAEQSERDAWLASAAAHARASIEKTRAIVRRRNWPETLPDVFESVVNDTLREWMAQDCGRGDFTIIANEQKATLQLAGKTLSLKIDRVEQRPDRTQIILDYKTGTTGKIKSLSDPKANASTQPQLPAYVLALSDTKPSPLIQGVGWGVVKPHAVKIRGVGVGQGAFQQLGGTLKPDAQETWDTLTQAWRASLTSSVTSLAQGDARVQPVSVSACTRCSRQALCRIRAAETNDDTDETSDE